MIGNHNDISFLLPNFLMPISTTNFVWDTSTTQKIIFEVMVRHNYSVKMENWLICNSTCDVEPAAFQDGFWYHTKRQAIGSEFYIILLALRHNLFRMAQSTAFYRTQYVIYVAFGSITVLYRTQFQELALDLKLSHKPFLWAVRPDITQKEQMMPTKTPKVLLDRVSSQAKIWVYFAIVEKLCKYLEKHVTIVMLKGSSRSVLTFNSNKEAYYHKFFYISLSLLVSVLVKTIGYTVSANSFKRKMKACVCMHNHIWFSRLSTKRLALLELV